MGWTRMWMKKGGHDARKKMIWFWQTPVKGESVSHVVDGRFQLERMGWGLSLVCHKSLTDTSLTLQFQ